MKNIRLGDLKRIDDLRSVWPNEAADFTPWLAERLDILNEATGLSLELVETESQVGGFSLDILARDTDTEGLAVIENQLEDSNHDHLGKLLTYAAGKDAKYVFWIVKSAREEHKAAIQWLNRTASEEIGYFLIEIQLWSINGSLPAPRLAIVEQPNGWTKAIRGGGGNDGDGPGAAIKYDYWDAFNKYAFANADFAKTFRKQPATSRSWYNFHLGSSLGHIAMTVNTKSNTLGVEFYMRHDKELFDSLFEQKEKIEKDIGAKLDWQRLDAKKASRILLAREADPTDRAKRPAQFDWLMKNVRAFRKTFSQYL